jgi:hypothetical protein
VLRVALSTSGYFDFLRCANEVLEELQSRRQSKKKIAIELDKPLRFR